MSAFIVDPEHIRVMVWALHTESPQGVGELLTKENYASVNYRYGESKVPPPYAHAEPRHTSWSAAELAAAFRCYDYQSCEHPGWADSLAHKMVREYMAELGEQPGRAGVWEIGENSVPAALAAVG